MEPQDPQNQNYPPYPPYPNQPQQPYNPYDPNDPNNQRPKQRHGCVTAWLIFALIVNSAVALFYLFGTEFVLRALPSTISAGIIYVLAFLCALNVVFAILLFQWKKWGFFGFVGTSLGAFLINISLGLPLGQSLFGLVGIGVLYGILQIKQNDVSTWEQLE